MCEELRDDTYFVTRCNNRGTQEGGLSVHSIQNNIMKCLFVTYVFL